MRIDNNTVTTSYYLWAWNQGTGYSTLTDVVFRALKNG